jgi:hypothetical protein
MLVDVAGDQHHVRRRLGSHLHHLIQGRGGLLVAGPPSQALPDVPVGGVKQPHALTLSAKVTRITSM